MAINFQKGAPPMAAQSSAPPAMQAPSVPKKKKKNKFREMAKKMGPPNPVMPQSQMPMGAGVADSNDPMSDY